MAVAETAHGGNVPAGRGRKQAANDRDALHLLPLSILPLKTPGLKRARMIKDSRLNSVVELFHSDDTGSGRVPPDKLDQCFNEESDALDADLEIIQQVATLYSFDVYTLRIELRRLEIPVNNVDSLKLSEEKNRELTAYMKSFTRPLIRQIYGDDGNLRHDFDRMEDLIDMFKSPDRDKVLMNIVRMAEKLQVKPGDVPEFLEEYGDVFLSLAYYRDIVDRLMTRVEHFTEDMREILSNRQVRNDPRVVETCTALDGRFSDIASWIAGRFESFERNSERLWENINAESFRRMKALITGHYTTIGGMLCGLQVKMDAWDHNFSRGRGGPLSKADFIMSDFRHGMDVIRRLEKAAPEIVDI